MRADSKAHSLAILLGGLLEVEAEHGSRPKVGPRPELSSAILKIEAERPASPER